MCKTVVSFRKLCSSTCLDLSCALEGKDQRQISTSVCSKSNRTFVSLNSGGGFFFLLNEALNSRLTAITWEVERTPYWESHLQLHKNRLQDL